MKDSSTMEQVYNDLNGIKIDHKDSFSTCMKKFYKVMRKHGIKQGTRNKDTGATSVCSAEWNMCWAVFKSNKILSLDIWLCLTKPPKDLQY